MRSLHPKRRRSARKESHILKRVNVLLLDFDPASGLGDALREIIASAPANCSRPGFQVKYESSLADFSNRQLTHLIAGADSEAILLVLPQSLLGQIGPWLQSLNKSQRKQPVIIITKASNPDDLLMLLEFGAADFITPPLHRLEILPRLWRLVEQPAPSQRLFNTLHGQLGLKQLIGDSAVFRAVIERIHLIAQCDAGVLITGETGTGKEICARAIHYLGHRAQHPFVPANCGAIPAELVENELFGHQRGAFTNAHSSQPGLIHEADGGTLFLDEIDCLPLLSQVKLLRFLEEKEYRPLGSAKTRQARVRVIAAANADLEQAVSMGKMRQDFYYRLNVISLRLPSLRERREDIPLLARHFLARYAAEFKKPATGFSSEALQQLGLYDWPGNVRELEHRVERAVALSEKPIIQSEDLDLSPVKPAPGRDSFQKAKAECVANFERAYLCELLRTYQGNITHAALAARKDRRALWQLIRKHEIDVNSFRSCNLSR